MQFLRVPQPAAARLPRLPTGVQRHAHPVVAAVPRRRSSVRAGQQELSSSGSPRQQEPGSRTLALQPAEADPAPYLAPLLRSFLLGVSFGALFEALHVLSQIAGVVQEVGPHQLSQLSQVLSVRSHELFQPLIFLDHAGGLVSWTLFYILEAFSVSAVLREFEAVRHAQADKEESWGALPKKLLPVQLDNLQDGLLRTLEKVSFSRVVLPRLPPRVQELTGLQQPPVSAFLEDDSPLAPSLPRPGTAAPSTLPPLPPPELDLPRSDPEAPQEPGPPSLEERRRAKGLAPGAWDTSTSQVARRNAELQGRAAFLKNFWYAAALSEKVGTSPVGVQLLGENLVLFRDSQGKVHCLGDVCPHRGAPLHQGWVAEADGHSCVVCPYHGWAFDQEGILRDVPAAEGHRDWSHKPMLDVFPVEEKGGFVWMFYGSSQLPVDERPPIPYCPELDDPSWRPVYGEIIFDCPHWSVFENAIDMAHIHYLHSGTFGNQEQPEIRDMTCSTNAYGVDASFRLHNKPVNALWDFSKVAEVHVTAQAMLPSTSVISFTLGRGLSFTTFVNTVPLDGQRTINRFALVRRLAVDPIGASFFLSPAWDAMARQAMIKILSEDKAMVEQLKPQALKREISVKADLVQLAFRKLREEYIAMGYGVSPEAAASHMADF